MKKSLLLIAALLLSVPAHGLWIVCEDGTLVVSRVKRKDAVGESYHSYTVLFGPQIFTDTGKDDHEWVKLKSTRDDGWDGLLFVRFDPEAYSMIAQGVILPGKDKERIRIDQTLPCREMVDNP